MTFLPAVANAAEILRKNLKPGWKPRDILERMDANMERLVEAFARAVNNEGRVRFFLQLIALAAKAALLAETLEPKAGLQAQVEEVLW